jgi:hypothetical protein
MCARKGVLKALIGVEIVLMLSGLQPSSDGLPEGIHRRALLATL